ncbi:hypothetical protein ScPMuIL_011211 [Solemya velum]
MGVKDLVLEPSSPLRHIAELKQILMNEELLAKPVLCIYSDGGPDHRLTYLSVQLAIACLFLSGQFDMIIAARTPPMASWKNPPERIMSILNLALQAVGLMRAAASGECERKMKSANGLGQLRELAQSNPEMRQEMVDSIEPVKTLLTQMFQRLKLKDRPFKCFSAASDADLADLWHELGRFGDDGHYKGFDELYGTVTTEEHRPSLNKVHGNAANAHGIPFSPSAQTAKTVKMTVNCVECDRPRVVYSATKISGPDEILLKRVPSLYRYSCGSVLQELRPEDPASAPRVCALLDKVFVRANLTCLSAIEVPYFSSGVFRPICYHCGISDDVGSEDGCYPTCETCKVTKVLPAKRKNVSEARAKRDKKQKK